MCVCLNSPWPSGSATGLQERPRRPPQDQGWFTNPRARGGLGWGAGGCGRGGVGKGSGMLTAWKLGPESRGTAKAPGLPGWKRRPDQGQALHRKKDNRVWPNQGVGWPLSPGQSPLHYPLSRTNSAVIYPSKFSVKLFTALPSYVIRGRLLNLSEPLAFCLKKKTKPGLMRDSVFNTLASMVAQSQAPQSTISSYQFFLIYALIFLALGPQSCGEFIQSSYSREQRQGGRRA